MRVYGNKNIQTRPEGSCLRTVCENRAVEAQNQEGDNERQRKEISSRAEIRDEI